MNSHSSEFSLSHRKMDKFDEMIDFLKAKRVNNWKLPERLEIRDEFPMTPSGKIQKFLLRKEIAELIGELQLIR